MNEKNIYQRLSLITEEAGQIPKRGKNTFSNYNYVLAVDVVGHIRKLLIKHGVHVSISETEDLKRYRDGKNFHCETTSTAKFINIDNPTDIHEVRYHAVAADTLDKDIYKAKTGGLKYLFSQEFKIITNDFIDVESSNDKPDIEPLGISIEDKAAIEEIKTLEGLEKFYHTNKGKNTGVLKDFNLLITNRKAEIEADIEKAKKEETPQNDSGREPGEEG